MQRPNISVRISALFSLCLPLLITTAPTKGQDYLPLASGKKWILKNPSERSPVVIEIIEKNSTGYRVRFSSPWSSNDWKLTPLDGRVALTGYGTSNQLMPLPESTIFFDFQAAEGHKWENAAGKLSVTSRKTSVTGGAGKFDNCITIKQTAGRSTFAYTFAAGVGFVQFGEGKNAFTLESLPGSPSATPPVSSAPPGKNGPNRPGKNGKVLLGTTVTTFANESEAPQALLTRFNQTVDAGVSYISAAGKWVEIEQSKEKYNFDSLNFQRHLAERNNAKMSYTLRLIDTIHKAVPSDLMKKGWNDPAMEHRVLSLIEKMAPYLKGRVQWFMFGNEVDGYFEKHPDEIHAFALLHDKVSKRLKELVPEIKVSTTFQFGGIDKLNNSLKELNDRCEFMSFTYYPMKGDFTVQDPAAPHRDLPKMKQVAGSRVVILQEIGYPSGTANKSNQDLQAQFFENVFAEMRADPKTFVAGSVFLLADLRDKFAKDLASYYGINGYEPFRSFLQTLGMFDGNGKPKKSWETFQRELRR